MITLSIATDFSKKPGLRYKDKSKYSGELFRESLLKPKYLEAKKNKVKLVVVLDGVKGYASSFLEEAFGGLARECPEDNIFDRIDLVATEEGYLIDDIKGYVEQANV